MDNALPDLPGFDMKAALTLLGDNAKLYSAILKRFRTRYAASLGELNAMLKGTDWDGILREAHALKGLAGSIGYPSLHEAAQALEQSVKDTDSPNPAEVGALADELLSRLSAAVDVLQRAHLE